MTVLGIDIGTTTIKAAVFSLADPSKPLAVASRRSPTVTSVQGYSETDPVAVRNLVASSIRELQAFVKMDEIEAIGISGTACGAWLVRDGEPVRPAILWNDGRAADIVDGWQAQGLMSEIFDISGNVPFPGYTLPLLRWLVDNEPDSVKAATHDLFCKDYIRGWLTGVWLSEESDASYAPFDIQKRTWSERLLKLAGVHEHAHLLPELAPVDRVDPLLPSIGHELGLRPGISVTMGATDIIAGCVGAGAVAPGNGVSILGTSANSSIITDTPKFEPHGIGIMAAAPLGRWVRTMVNTSGSMTIDWAANLFCAGDVASFFACAQSANTEDLPAFVPYLADAGVISPFVDAKARGTFVGLRARHGKAELCRAVVDGLAFAIADGYRIIPGTTERIVAVGGAAKSDLLLQTIADATGALVLRPQGSEFGARGAALLSALHSKLYSQTEFEQAARNLDFDHCFEPCPEHVLDRLERYRVVVEGTQSMGRLW